MACSPCEILSRTAWSPFTTSLPAGCLRRLRDNVRSLGEYASQRAGDESGRTLVRGFFAALEAFDGALRQVSEVGC